MSEVTPVGPPNKWVVSSYQLTNKITSYTTGFTRLNTIVTCPDDTKWILLLQYGDYALWRECTPAPRYICAHVQDMPEQTVHTVKLAQPLPNDDATASMCNAILACEALIRLRHPTRPN